MFYCYVSTIGGQGAGWLREVTNIDRFHYTTLVASFTVSPLLIRACTVCQLLGHSYISVSICLLHGLLTRINKLVSISHL